MQRIEDMGLTETFRLIEKLPEGVRRQQALAHALDELLEEFRVTVIPPVLVAGTVASFILILF